MRFLTALALLLNGCSTGYKPCALGGDTDWFGIPKEKRGDSYCRQKLFGREYKNHGQYWLNNPKGKKILEGEFREGLKQGVWVQYDETGKKVAERTFENGAEIQARGVETRARTTNPR